MTRMDCLQCEERMSDYLENALGVAERGSVELHLGSCNACSELLAGMTEVLVWGKTYPIYETPSWLTTRILAQTPRVTRETWVDTLVAVGRWIIEPRTAMAVFTATLVLGWLGNIAGISPNWAEVVRDPAGIYYGAETLVNRTYAQAVRTYYRSPLVTQIQSRIEQLREIS